MGNNFEFLSARQRLDLKLTLKRRALIHNTFRIDDLQRSAGARVLGCRPQIVRFDSFSQIVSDSGVQAAVTTHQNVNDVEPFPEIPANQANPNQANQLFCSNDSAIFGTLLA